MTRLARAAIEQALVVARAAWPGFTVDADEFGKALAARVAVPLDAADIGPAMKRMHVADLYLVVACAAGDGRALAALEATYFDKLRASLGKKSFEPAAVEEALQSFRSAQLVGKDGQARILDYAARGPLGWWLSIVVSRILLKTMRSVRREVELDPSFSGEAGGDLELEFLKKQYGAVFHEALARALAELPREDRLLLKQRYALQTTVVELGVLHGVHASTISRRVTEIRERLVRTTRTLMMARLSANAPEVSSILRLIHSDMDLSLSTHDELRSARA
jgi:RNA polymerase sigma-70 factor (ECF subfamily)